MSLLIGLFIKNNSKILENKFYNVTDQYLLENISTDASAFEEIYNKYWQSLFSYAYKRSGSKEIAEEMVQELFMKLWERRKCLKISNNNLCAYLFTAIKYTVVNYYQAKKVRNVFMEQSLNKLNAENTTEQHVFFKEVSQNFENAINTLPVQCRKIFKLSREEHYSMKEIAFQLNISPKTVENHLGRAIKVIKVYMKDFVLVVSAILIY